MAKQAREQEQALLATLEESTGHSLTQWMSMIPASGETKTNAIIKWIKATHSLNHRQATLLTGIYLNDGKPVYDYEVMFAKLFEGKAEQRPLYNELHAAITAAIPEAGFIPTKAYVSIEAERVFGCVKINARNIRLGLDLGEAPFTDTLVAAKGLGAMPNIAHMTELTHVDAITADVSTAVKQAYLRQVQLDSTS